MWNKEQNNIIRAQMLAIINRYRIEEEIPYTVVSRALPHITAKHKKSLAITLDKRYVRINIYKNNRITYTKLKDIPEQLTEIPLQTAKEIVLWGMAKNIGALSLRTLTQYTRVLDRGQRLNALAALVADGDVATTETKPKLYHLT